MAEHRREIEEAKRRRVEEMRAREQQIAEQNQRWKEEEQARRAQAEAAVEARPTVPFPRELAPPDSFTEDSEGPSWVRKSDKRIIPIEPAADADDDPCSKVQGVDFFRSAVEAAKAAPGENQRLLEGHPDGDRVWKGAAGSNRRKNLPEDERRRDSPRQDRSPPLGDPPIARHEISEEDRYRLWREQRDAAKRNCGRVRDLGRQPEAQRAIEDPSECRAPPPTDDRISRHEISDEDRYRLWREQRDGAKRNRRQARGVEYRPQVPQERAAAGEISDEERLRVWHEQLDAAKQKQTAAPELPEWARNGRGQGRLLPKIHDDGDEEAANEDLRGLAASIREALDIDPEAARHDEVFGDARKRPRPFYMNGDKIRLPAGSDRESLIHRAEAIRALLERKMGLEKLAQLSRELESQRDDERVPQSTVDECDPGALCLARHLMVLNETLER
jgi:hypothetical protein